MAENDDDRIRVKSSAPKSRGGPRSQRFVSQVLKQVSKTGAKPSGKSLGRSANAFGRGRVAASVAGQRLGPNARRVVIKSRFVVLRRASPNSAAVHLRYIERDGVTRDGQKGQAYGAETDAVDLKPRIWCLLSCGQANSAEIKCKRTNWIVAQQIFGVGHRHAKAIQLTRDHSRQLAAPETDEAQAA